MTTSLPPSLTSVRSSSSENPTYNHQPPGIIDTYVHIDMYILKMFM